MERRPGGNRDRRRRRTRPLGARNGPRRESRMPRRCTTADGVAKWVQEQHGLGGPSGLSGQKENTKISSTRSTKSTQSSASTPSTFPEIAANAALVLIAVACSLLDRQLVSLAVAFEREGGFTERLYRVRKSARRAGR